MRTLSLIELSFVSGGYGETNDAADFFSFSGGSLSVVGYIDSADYYSDDFGNGDNFGNDNLDNLSDPSLVGEGAHLNVDLNSDINDTTVVDGNETSADIIVTATMTHDEIKSMESKAEYMTDAELVIVAAGSGYAGAAAGLGVVGSAVLGGATTAATNHLTAEQMNAKNFAFLYAEKQAGRADPMQGVQGGMIFTP